MAFSLILISLVPTSSNLTDGNHLPWPIKHKIQAELPQETFKINQLIPREIFMSFSKSNREDDLTWYLRVIPLKIPVGILFQMFLSISNSGCLSGFVCPNPLPKEHSLMLALDIIRKSHGLQTQLWVSRYLHIEGETMKIIHKIRNRDLSLSRIHRRQQ